MTEKKVFIVQALLLGAFLSVPVGVSAAEDGRSGLGMNGKRMGPPTVEECVQRTGKTTTECQATMDNFQLKRQDRDVLREGKDGSRERGTQVGTNQGRFGMETTHRFADIKTRIDKVIVFLASKGADTSVLQSGFAVLKDKMTSAEADYIALQKARETWKADRSITNKATLDSARTTAQVSTNAVKVYYHDTLLPILKTLLQSVA